MRSSTPLSVGGLALAGIVIASVAVISATGGDTSVADRMALASVKRGTVASYVSAAGNTIDTGVRDLAFGAEGTVEKVYVRVGQKVRRGKVLARIDDTIARENYEAAKAALAAAQETLDDVENGTGSGSAGGSGTGASSGGTGSGSAGGAGTGASGGGSGAGASGRGTGSGSAGGAGASGGATGAGAGAGNAGGSGSSGPVSCPTPSVRPSGQASARPSSQPSSRPSATARPSNRPASALANKGASAASIGLVAYRGGDHGGSKPQPSPAPTVTARPHPHPKPSRTHRPAPTDSGATAPDPEVSVSILPTAPAQQPSAKPSPSPSGSSSACAPGQSGQGQGSQGQNSQGQSGQGQSRQGQGGGAQGRAGFGGGQAGQGGQGGGARLTEAQAEAQVSQATTELAEAKEALAGVRIKAPADGTILSVAGTTGSRYTSGTFITLGNLDDLQVQALFTESDIRFLKVGQAATVTLPTQPGQEYPGTVAHIDPTATTSNRLVRYGVTIVLNSRPARLLLGQSATVRVTTGEAADALYVPSQAVRAQGDGTAVVTVANGGTQSRRTVKVGVRGDSYVEITGGLSEGDQIVLPVASTAFPDEGFPAAGQFNGG
ncbi:efflux RND transporter periplasmic adaptor subunit [Microbispora sp. NEAU-D428]|uniref:efflux RND transporter periplasmic adaptor subunit n=1 Tax=Microbispora sitophila TaxID=2771537 RepID=UPI001868FC5B|nr:efflux RND transporter periplasmic adaptor subunit [Microbispora sitophila]MBE3013581.1 efflux RND transporter periplasmic adaptor subunit [Microbispora sitophila]